MPQGGRMRHILASITSNPFKGMLVGAFITAVMQSSSATTVMLVGFASSGLMDLTQTVGVILGADIGTTVTVQLIAFQFFDYALLLVVAGYLLIFATKRKIFKYIGQATLGFGFIFFAMKVMSDAMVPLRQSEVVKVVLISLGDHPIVGILVAAILSAMVASSAATIGLAITLALQGLLPLHAAIPVIFGANIGTCATALASSIGAETEAKRVAIAHIFFKVVGVLVFLPVIHPFVRLVEFTANDVPRQIVNAHTLFNVGITALFLPFSYLLARVVSNLVPEGKEGEGFFTRNDLALARQVLEQKLEISQTERKFRQAHIQRLHEGYREAIDISEIHMDVLTNLKRIKSHITAVAYPILGST